MRPAVCVIFSCAISVVSSTAANIATSAKMIFFIDRFVSRSCEQARSYPERNACRIGFPAPQRLRFLPPPSFDRLSTVQTYTGFFFPAVPILRLNLPNSPVGARSRRQQGSHLTGGSPLRSLTRTCGVNSSAPWPPTGRRCRNSSEPDRSRRRSRTRSCRPSPAASGRRSSTWSTTSPFLASTSLKVTSRLSAPSA